MVMTMRKGLVIVGVILLVIGLLMFLFMWPIVSDAETPEDFIEKSMAGEYGSGDTVKVKGEVTEVLDLSDLSGFDDLFIPGEKFVYLDGGEILGVKFPFPVPSDLDVSKGDTVILEYEENEIRAQKVPSPAGIIGLILLIIGVLLLIVGAATGKAAAVPLEQPPMEQPYQQPYQEPYQQPPPQQPPMPPQ